MIVGKLTFSRMQESKFGFSPLRFFKMPLWTIQRTRNETKDKDKPYQNKEVTGV